jgi:hypothetical protein
LKWNIASNCNKISGLLEVQQLTIVVTPTILSSPTPPNSFMEHEKTLTLSEVFQVEAQCPRDKHEVMVSEVSRNDPGVPNLYTFRGTVRARSPILSVPKKDDQSFILVEIVDDTETYRCIIVIRQEALSVAEQGIAVNDEIVWVRVPRRKWRVPQSLNLQNHHHTLNEIPAQVFVVENMKQIQWNRKSIPTKQTTSCFSTSTELCDHGRPVQGIIERVHWIRMDDKTGRQKQRIHWLQMVQIHETKDCEGNSGLDVQNDIQNRQRKNGDSTAWFVTYFPMSSCLQLSLRPGAKLWGFHLHKIANDSYCACLHSQIVLMEHSTTQQQPTQSLSAAATACWSLPLDPYEVTTKIRIPYSEWVCRRWVAELLSEMKQNIKGPSLQELPSLDIATAHISSGLHPNNTYVYSKKRNVYAEFLDCHENKHLDEGEDELPNDDDSRFGRTHGTIAGCHVSRFEQSGGASMHLPRPVSLTDIQELAFQSIEQRIKEYIMRGENDKPIPIGWTGSIRLFEHEITQYLGGDSEECRNFYTLGYYQHGEMEIASGNMVSTPLSNGRVEIPVVLDMTGTCDCPSKTKGTQNGTIIMNATKAVQWKEFMWVRIRSVAVSCICFRNKAHNGQRRKQKILKLPKVSKNGTSVGVQSSCTGPCAILVTDDGYCFFVALFLVCDHLLPFDPCAAPLNHTVRYNTGQLQKNSPSTLLCSVAECLGSNIDNNKSDNEIISGTESTESAPAAFISLLARSSFKPHRVKNGMYRDYYITIAQAPFSSLNPIAIPDELNGIHEISCVQSIELKAHVAIDESMCKTLRRFMASFLDDGHNHSYNSNLDDQLGLCVARWKLAICGQTCALLGGGWDEAPGPSRIKKAAADGTIVQIPTKVLLRDHKHGYVRIRCTSDDIVASVITFSRYKSNDRTQWDKYLNFDFFGGKKFTEGSLDQRPSRRQYDMAFGELLVEQVASGVPTCSLAELFTTLCEALKSGSVENLSPSLVVEIRGAEFLGVSYCRAIAECSKCYATLHDPSSRTPENARKKNIINTYVSANLCMQRSFWHLPLPSRSTESNTQNALENGADLSKSRWTSSLVCPNSCPVDEFGTVKWECSGTLDDGTAQARLYAERQTALCLLGLPQSAIKCIEKAAWLNEDGVVFSKTMIPESDVRKAILSARTQAQNYLQVHKNVKSLNDSDVMVFLTPKFRAEYLMQTHCRFSTLPLRKLNYLVRVKPMSHEISMLDQTAVEINKKDIATYTLPALSLKLVDCATSMLDAYPDNWNPFS